MIITIDAGNSRIKLAAWDGSRITARASVATGEDVSPLFDGLGAVDCDSVIVSQVGPAAGSERLIACCDELGLPAPRFFETGSECCGVVHGYDDPSQHGVDRWAAVIGAHRLFDGAVCVVDAGTAITFDLVDPDGRHKGGLIFPGYRLMLDSLVHKFSGIHDAGADAMLATATDDAVAGGCRRAVEGGVERICRQFSSAVGDGLRVVFTGGYGGALRSSVAVGDSSLEPDLVMHGLRLYAEAGG